MPKGEREREQTHRNRTALVTAHPARLPVFRKKCVNAADYTTSPLPGQWTADRRAPSGIQSLLG